MALLYSGVGYKGGRIVSIVLENFMIYESITFRPETGLNLLLGVNGSGKSSIMCAICLCLGGKPCDTGKSLHTVDFIRDKSSSAVIIIELDDPKSKKNIFVKREIKSTGTSVYFVNNSKVDLERLSLILLRFNIQVNNLCQFLPQEKVSDFARQSPQQLLKSMQQAVGDSEIYNNYESLIRFQEETAKYGKELEECENFIKKEQQKNNSIQIDVDKFAKRESFQQDLIKLNEQRAILVYLDKKQNADVCKKKITASRNELNLLTNQLKTKEKEFRVLEKELKRIEGEKNFLVVEICQKYELLNKLRRLFTQAEEKMYDEKLQFDRKLSAAIAREQRAEQLEKEINELKIEYKKQQQMASCRESELQRVLYMKEQVRKDNLEAHIELLHLVDKQKEIAASIGALNIQLKRIDDIQQKKIDFLKSNSPDSYAAMLWLRDNRSRFRKQVYDPLMLLIEVKQEKYMKVIENHIPFKSMVMFLCEDSEDAKLFTKILREEKRLKVNSALIPDRVPSFESQLSRANLQRQHRLDCYLRDTFSTPAAVMKYLCYIHYVHAIPVCTSDHPDVIQPLIRQVVFPKFYSVDYSYSVRKSLYGAGNVSSCVNKLLNKGMLCHVCSKEDKLKCQAELKEFEQQRSVIEEKKMVAQSNEEDLKLKQVELKKQEDQLRHLDNVLKRTCDNIAQKEHSLCTLRGDTFNLEEEKKSSQLVIKSLDDEKFAILTQLNETISKCIVSSVKKTKILFTITCHSGKNRKLRDEAKEIREKLTQEDNQLAKHNELYVELKESVKGQIKLVEEALGIPYDANRSNADRRILIQNKSQEQFGGNFCPDLITLESKISKIKAILNHIMVADSSVVSEYQNREKLIKEKQDKMGFLKGQLSVLKADMERVKSLWWDPLQDLVSKVSSRFSDYFERLGCAGEVAIVSSNAYQEYGLAIRVKYRDDAPLKQLSQSHHSGGERSVAVIIFILSLQELTEVPFRCVDEINQGMDSIYERKIFDFIKASAENCSQYFLLTPKLLPDLMYSRKIKIHIIHNGRSQKLPSFDIAKMLRKKSALCNGKA